MRVLLTGGAGYVGSALVCRLCQRTDLSEIVVYDNLGRGRGLFLQGPARPVTPVRLVQADLLDTRSLMAALRGIDVVVHLAARVTTPYAHDDLHGFDQVNRWGTGELGLAVERVGGVRRVVYASSTAVYGDTQGGPASASRGTRPAPVSAYGHAKLEGERLLGELDPAVALTVLRLGNVHGLAPAMRFDSLVNRMLFDAWTAGRVQVEGSGDEHRPLLHVESAARALEAAALGELPTGTLDLVDANARTLDVVRALRAFLPQTEVLFISQHLTLPDAVVDRDPRLPAALHDDRPLAAQLDEEARRFAFGAPRA